MKILATNFNAQGHFLRQIWREKDVAVYERSLSPEHLAHELELVIIEIQEARLLPSGIVSEFGEVYPGSSKWGSLSWSFPIRYRDWVLALGRKVAGISKKRAGFVRQASHEFWLQTHESAKQNGGAF